MDLVAGLLPLAGGEMQEILGGMDVLAPTRDSGFWYDVCWCIGRAAAGVVAALEVAPASNYMYAKVGYTN